MNLIALLIALAFDRIDRGRTSKHLLSTITDLLCGGWGLGGLFAFVSAVFLVHTVLLSLSTILGAMFSTAVLVVCLGTGELIAGVSDYLHLRARNDEQEANQIVSILVGREIVYSSSLRLARDMLAGVLVEGHVRGGGLIFWYLILGPAGALLAVLARRIALPTCAACNSSQLISTIYWGIDWLPARLSALFYGLAGSLTHALDSWRARAWSWDAPNTVVLVASGTGALLLDLETSGDALTTATLAEQDTAIENVLALLMRTLIVWVMVVALVTVGGWFN